MPQRRSVRLIRVRGPFEYDPDSTDTLLRTLAIFSPPFSHSLRLTQIICSGDGRPLKPKSYVYLYAMKAYAHLSTVDSHMRHPCVDIYLHPARRYHEPETLTVDSFQQPLPASTFIRLYTAKQLSRRPKNQVADWGCRT